MTEIYCKCGASRLEDIMCADCGDYFRAVDDITKIVISPEYIEAVNNLVEAMNNFKRRAPVDGSGGANDPTN